MHDSRRKARKKRLFRRPTANSTQLGAFYASPSSEVQRTIDMTAIGSIAGRLPMQKTGAFICGVTMPSYEYICEKCDHQFDVVQSMKDRALTVCPQEKCGQKKWGKGKVKRMISSGGGLIFKGSGFYITDYRSDSYKEAAKKDVAPAADSGSKAADSKGKTEAAPKAESKPKETKTPKTDKS